MVSNEARGVLTSANDNFLSKKKNVSGDSISIYDKVSLKFANWNEDDFKKSGFRALPGSVVRRGSYIGKNVVLIDATVGPNVSLGDGSHVQNSEIKNSLVQNHSHIKNAHLDNAMIGNHVSFDGNFTSISIGDYSVLE